MDTLTNEERVVFIGIYSGEQDDVSIPATILESLINQGLLVRGANGTINPTEHGGELYQQLTDDEPYEGV